MCGCDVCHGEGQIRCNSGRYARGLELHEYPGVYRFGGFDFFQASCADLDSRGSENSIRHIVCHTRILAILPSLTQPGLALKLLYFSRPTTLPMQTSCSASTSLPSHQKANPSLRQSVPTSPSRPISYSMRIDLPEPHTIPIFRFLPCKFCSKTRCWPKGSAARRARRQSDCVARDSHSCPW
jgi:hypothetical protein